MDVLALLSQAKVNDSDGVELGEVIGIHFVAGRMIISISMDLDEEEDDGDDGAKDDIPEDDASKVEFPRLAALTKKDGTSG